MWLTISSAVDDSPLKRTHNSQHERHREANYYPFVHAVLHAAGILIEIKYLFAFEVVGWGSAVIICDMRIYMLFEGRRYWPSRVRNYFLSSEIKRLDVLYDIVRRNKSSRRKKSYYRRHWATLKRKLCPSARRQPPIGRQRFKVLRNLALRRKLEAIVKYAFFPVDDGGEPHAEFSTRLGNLIEAFETYPKVKYGLDAVFYWYRLWVTLDKDLREEIDNAQAVADSTVYMAFTFFLGGVLMFIYAITKLVLYAGSPFFHWLQAIELPYIPEPQYLVGLALVCFVSGFSIYRLSLPTHAQFGELFKSVL